MNEQRRSRRDFLQNITIAVLTVSAVLLFIQTQLVNLSAANPLSQFFSGPDVQVSTVIPTSQDVTRSCAPVRVAAASAYGRYGGLAVCTDDEDYLPLGQLLTQALSSAPGFTAVPAESFLTALKEAAASVYYDFLVSLPLSVLADLAQTRWDSDDLSARYLLLAEEDSGVTLYLWDGGNRCFRCGTTLSSADLSGTVSQYELGNASFAFEDAVEHAGALAPCTLLPSQDPHLPQLAVSASLSDSSQLLSSLGFNPNTQNRYWESDTTEVITESDGRTLRLSPDGSVLYQSGHTPALSIQTAGDSPTLAEAAGETRSLLEPIFSTLAGDARLYLEQIRQTGSLTTLRFACHVDGVPIRFTDGGCAALVTLNGNAVSALELRLRQYTVTETDSLLLPLRQALAIAADGVELTLGYTDGGGDTVNAAWLAD